MITTDQVRKLSPRDGDVFVVPQNISDEDAKALVDAVRAAVPDIKAILIRGDLEQLDEAAMNAAGWYRK